MLNVVILSAGNPLFVVILSFVMLNVEMECRYGECREPLLKGKAQYN